MVNILQLESRLTEDDAARATEHAAQIQQLTEKILSAGQRVDEGQTSGLAKTVEVEQQARARYGRTVRSLHSDNPTGMYADLPSNGSYQLSANAGTPSCRPSCRRCNRSSSRCPRAGPQERGARQQHLQYLQ